MKVITFRRYSEALRMMFMGVCGNVQYFVMGKILFSFKHTHTHTLSLSLSLSLPLSIYLSLFFFSLSLTNLSHSFPLSRSFAWLFTQTQAKPSAPVVIWSFSMTDAQTPRCTTPKSCVAFTTASCASARCPSLSLPLSMGKRGGKKTASCLHMQQQQRALVCVCVCVCVCVWIYLHVCACAHFSPACSWLTQPTHAHRSAIGAGLCLAAACDMRIIATTAKVGWTFVGLGLHPGMAATHFTPQVLGIQRAAMMLLTGTVSQCSVVFCVHVHVCVCAYVFCACYALRIIINNAGDFSFIACIVSGLFFFFVFCFFFSPFS